jgi:hypothetical protein
MRFPTLAYVLSAAAVPLLASCAGSNGSMMPQAASQSANAAMQSDAKPAAYAYISDSIASIVTVYGSDGSEQRKISAGLKNPAGLFVDSKNNLWVANSGANNTLEFAPGATKPSHTLAGITGGEPEDVTICPNGSVYVAGGANIAIYKKASAKSTSSITYPQAQAFSGITCDAKGNVFASGIVYFASAVIKFPHGDRKGAVQIPIAGSSGSIKTEASGDLLVNDQATNTIAEFTEAGVATGHAIITTANASCLSFGISQTGMVGCPVYVPYQSSGTIATTYAFPKKQIKQTFTSTLMSQPYSFAFAN